VTTEGDRTGLINLSREARPVTRTVSASDDRTILITTVSSDAHTWNLVFLQLLLEEAGFPVVNLGACVPDELVLAECRRIRPDTVVVSTVNGHGGLDGARLIRRLGAEPDLAGIRVVIGGKLGVRGRADRDVGATLQAAGYDAVFLDDADPAAFLCYLAQRPRHRLTIAGGDAA
jgi:methylaspartate mutase sigma subunit